MDPDPSRRRFLGAAAAMWNLPHGDQLRLYTDYPQDELLDGEGEKEYPRRSSHGGLVGGVHVEEYGDDAQVEISVYPHQDDAPISLEVVLGEIRMGACVGLDDARAIVDDLTVAVDDVEAWRSDHRLEDDALGGDHERGT